MRASAFPVIAMEPFPKYWGEFLPLRWYIQILFDQAARGSPISASAVPFAVLASMQSDSSCCHGFSFGVWRTLTVCVVTVSTLSR
jgi:ABC-2 type transport system permease protein